MRLVEKGITQFGNVAIGKIFRYLDDFYVALPLDRDIDAYGALCIKSTEPWCVGETLFLENGIEVIECDIELEED